MVTYRRSRHELKLSKQTEEYMKEMQKEFMPEDSKVGLIQLWLDNFIMNLILQKTGNSKR